MPIPVQCGGCGRAYNLKDSFAGMAVKCPNCGGVIQAPAAAAQESNGALDFTPSSPIAASSAPPPLPPAMPAAPPAPTPGGNYLPAPPSAGGFGAPAPDGYGAPAPSPGYGAPASGGYFAGAPSAPMHNYGSDYANFAFNRDKFLLRQKVMAISAKYYVWDEAGRSILFVERPAHLLRNLTAMLAGLMAGGITFVLIFGVFLTLAGATQTDWLMAPGLILGIPLGIVALIGVNTLLCKKRHVTIYQDDTKQAPLLQIFQDKKFWIINATYTVATMDGQMLARFHKNSLYNILRKRWIVRNAADEVLYLAKEDSIINAIVRRFITALLVTNFIIVAVDNDDIKFGEFNRKFTLLDRYVLDLSPDWQRQLDRRVALALGIMLDTGESR